MSFLEKGYRIDMEDAESSATTDQEIGQVINLTGARKQAVTRDEPLNARLQRFVRKIGIEQRGIERVPENERTDSSMTQVGTLWLSANMVVSSFAIGALAIPVFNLGYVAASLTIIFINILGTLPVCFFSIFGPRFGLRQMVLSRFYFGFYGVKLVACFNILASIGWAATNSIVGAQLLHAVNNGVPGWAGIVAIMAATFVVCTFGYRLVHAYERYAWLPCFLVFVVAAAVFGRSGAFDAHTGTGKSPAATAGSVLSFAASVFGFATGWTAFAADYTVYQPPGRARVSVFAWTFAGLFVPLVFTQLLGAAIATAMVAHEPYALAYRNAGVGGLVVHVLVPPLGRFGQFCAVVLALSIVANNCPNVYSAALSLQVLHRGAERVPRFLWTGVGSALYVAVAIPGYNHFADALENFLLLIGYWLAIYEAVALTEHFVFRRGFGGYDVEDYNIPERLPRGWAAIAAFVVGAAGAVLGMAQKWFTGPIGKLCGGELGGDVGFELAFGFTAVAYCAFRGLEKRCFRR
ncbi:purine-cytosine permease [Xylariomycetidae sp. FL0641]|nr:purine-cytosine permease [Xylariomycetidae sp. FL0641]